MLGIHVSVDVPISSSDARRLEVPRHVCRLLYSLDPSSRHDSEAIATVLGSLLNPGSVFLIQAENPFKPARTMIQSGGITEHHLVSGAAAVWAFTPTELQYVLQHWNAEKLMVTAGSRESGEATVQEVLAHRTPLWKFSSGCYEIRYLKCLPRQHWVGSYSPIRSSLELFGDWDKIAIALRSAAKDLIA